MDELEEEDVLSSVGRRNVSEDSLTVVEDAMAAIPGAEGTKAKFYRIDPKTRKQEYLFTVPFESGLDLEETVRSRAGGGEILVVFVYPRGIRDTEGRGSRSLTFALAGAPRDPTAPEGAAPAPAANGGGDVALRLEVARLSGLVEGLKGSQAAAPLDPMGMIDKLAATMRALQPTTAPLPADPMSMIEKVVGAVSKFVEVGRDIAPVERVPGTDWGHVVDRTVDAVTELIQENKRVTGGAGQGQGAGTAPPPALPPGVEALPPWQQEVLAWVPRLVDRAQADKDPGVAADVFVEDVSGSTRAALRGMAGQEGFVAGTLAQLGQVVPASTAYAGWFTDFLTAVRDLLQEEQPADPNGNAPQGVRGAGRPPAGNYTDDETVSDPRD